MCYLKKRYGNIPLYTDIQIISVWSEIWVKTKTNKTKTNKTRNPNKTTFLSVFNERKG